MRPANNDKQRRHREATSAAMKRAVRKCRSCGRGQVPTIFHAGNGRSFWTCRYCKHEHGPAEARPVTGREDLADG